MGREIPRHRDLEAALIAEFRPNPKGSRGLDHGAPASSVGSEIPRLTPRRRRLEPPAGPPPKRKRPERFLTPPGVVLEIEVR